MAAEIESIHVKFGADTVEFDSGIKGINAALTQLRKDLTNTNKQLKFDPENTDLLNKRLENLQQQAQLGADKIQALKAEQDQLGEGKIGTDEWNKLELSIKDVEVQMQGVDSKISETKSQLSELGNANSVTNLNKKIEDTAAQLDIVDRKLKLDPTNTELAANRMELLGTNAQLTDQKIEALKLKQSELADQNVDSPAYKNLQMDIGNAEIKAMELKNEISGVGTQAEVTEGKAKGMMGGFGGGMIGGAVAGGLMMIGSKVMELGGDMVAEADNVEIFKKSLSAEGFSAGAIEEAKSELEDYQKTSVYGFGSITDAARKFASAQINDFTGVTTGLATLNQATGGTEESFNAVVKALMTTEAKGTVSSKVLSTLFKQMPGAVKPIEDELMKLGGYTTFDDLQKAMSKSQISARDLNTAIRDVGNSDSFKKMAGNNLTIAQNMDRVKEAAIGAGEQVIEAFGGGNMTQAVNKLISMISSIGKVLANIVTYVMNHKDVFKALGVAIMVVVSALGAMKIATVVAETLQGFSKAMGIATVAQEEFDVAASSNPLGLIVIAIAAVTAALVYFFTQTETGRNIIKNVWGEIQVIFTTAKNIILGVIDAIKAGISAFINFFAGFFQAELNIYLTIFTTVFNAIKTVIFAVINGVRSFFTAELSFWSNLFKTSLAAIRLVFTTVFNAISTAITFVVTGIRTFFTNEFLFWKNLFTTSLNAIVTVVTTVFNAIRTAISTAMATVKSVVTTVINDVKTVFSNGVNAILGFFSGIGSRIALNFTGLVDKVKSAIGDMASVGRKIIDDIISGLSGLANRVWQAVMSAFNAARTRLGDLIGNLFKADGSVSYSIGGAPYGEGVITRIKAIGSVMPQMPTLDAIGASNNSNWTINVNANGSGAAEIAEAVETVIVRRLNR